MTRELTGLEIAVIGISGRFPNSKNVESFWENLINGKELTSIFPESNPGQANAAGGILEDVELFDASFFGFNPREAEAMDPQHRLFLEAAWEALENAGYDCERESRPIGVYAGVGISTYLLYNLNPNQELIRSRGFVPTIVGVDKDYLPTRVSYKLNLTGPSVSVGTACSSSLVAVHLACQSLLSGECDMALAAGVSVKVPQNESILSPGEMASPDGQCRAFAAGANGTIGGNGIGVVVLKRLEDALADRDYIYGVIKGSAINNDGAVKVGYTAPSQEGQAKVIRSAQIMAEVEPETISYIEAHGTGTTLGDPIEIAALTQAFRASTDKKGYCAIGSVKTNVGHLDAAAGITGLIKTVLALDRQLLPPSLHFDAPSPEINFENSPFYVNTELSEWKTNGNPRRAGVSSFGFGGTNAHVILEEAPLVVQECRSAEMQGRYNLLVFSAKTSSALDAATTNLVVHLKQHPEINLADVAYTLQVGRQVFAHRRMVIVEDIEDAIKALESPQILTQCEEKNRPVVFMFTGQGSQYVNMAQELYQNRVFRQECDRCCELLQPQLGLDLRSYLYPTEADAEQAAQQLQQTAMAQPALFVIEYALAKLWMSWGINPVAAIGHSIGEYVAACIAGVFSLEDALALVTARGQLMQQLPFHTSHALEPFQARVKQVKLNPPQIPYISNITGTWITAEEATNPAYWTAHIQQTVRFAVGLQELLKQSDRILLEVGPGRTLSELAKQHPDKQPQQMVLTTLRDPQEQQSDVKFLLNTLGQLWLAGVQIDWSRFYADEKRDRLPLPTYPFERQRYWIEPPHSLAEAVPKRCNPLVKAGIQASKEIVEDDRQTYLTKQQLLEICTAYINLALRQNGAFNNLEQKYSLEELSKQCQIIPRYQPLLARWLQVLIEKGQLQQEGEKFTNLVPCSRESFKVLLEQVRVNWAGSPRILDLVRQCGENLADVITGKQEPLQFFKGLLYEFNQAENTTLKSLGHERYSAIIRAILGQATSLLSAQRNLRILEIASGVNYATEELISVLPSSQTSYTFADVSGSFLIEANQKFSKYPFIECRCLDLDRSLSEQGYSQGSFDVVIAVKSLHTAKNIEATLENIRSLLAPGGVLLLWEKTQATLDFYITWALLLNSQESSRLDNPYLSKEQWQKALHSSKFVEVTALPQTEVAEHILLAQASREQQDICQTPVSIRKKQDIADWFYVPSWKRATLPQSVRRLKQSEVWLVFVDKSGLGAQILKQLEIEGQDAIAVRIGERFSKFQSQRVYTINPQSKDDYNALIAELLDLNWTPTKILHLWSATPQSQTISRLEALDRTQETGFYSLLFLVQALSKRNLTDLEIVVIANNIQSVTGEEIISPEKATLLGAIKTIPLEYPHIRCRSIDVILPTVFEEKLLEQLWAEFSTSSSDQIIAYRGNHRWVQTFEPVSLDKAEVVPQFREGGVYLITGGLGGIGLIMAEHLAQTVRAKLILCGRSEFPHRNQWEQWLASHEESDRVSEKIRSFQALEKLGAEVLIINADVSDRQQMQALVNQARDRFGEINGIIHAAGVAIPGKIQSRTLETVESVLAAKVKGVLVLEAILQDTPIDFLALFSSLSSLSGGYAVDYVAANTFLDTYAHYRIANHNSFTVAINWDNWQQVGMALQAEVPEELKPFYAENQKNSITAEEGIDAFNRILQYRLPQIVVSGRNLQVAIAQHHSAKAIETEAEVSPPQKFYPRPNLGNFYVSPRDRVEQTLADIWQQLLGIEKVGIYDNFLELGGDSILSFQVALKANQSGLQLKPNQLFEHPTIADLALASKQTTEKDLDEQIDSFQSTKADDTHSDFPKANLTPIELNIFLTKINRKEGNK